MTQVLDVGVKEIVLSNTSFGPTEVEQILYAIGEDNSKFGVLRDSVAELETRQDRTPAAAVRLGVCLFLLGRYQSAIDTLSKADGGAMAHFYTAKAYVALGKFQQAITSFKSAKAAGYNGDQCALGTVEALRGMGNLSEAFQTVDQLYGPVEQTGDYLTQRAATIALMADNPKEVIALFERAVDLESRHVGALFGLALENDRRGNDEVALELYERASRCFPTHLGALLNLGLLYEDRQQYERAAQCYQRVLDSFPEHSRARLYYKDATASSSSIFDEDPAKRNQQMQQILNVPVSDFELSVRSRNCLQKMGIATLGDLTRTTEQELLASKNFGETSLIEIREMLRSKGLELGQHVHERPEAEPPIDTSTMSPDQQAILERPISDLNLSVRARKCMVRLGLQSIGELIRKTGDDLLECKNFGVTSLNEVRDKLTQMGLKLRGD